MTGSKVNPEPHDTQSDQDLRELYDGDLPSVVAYVDDGDQSDWNRRP